MIFDHQQIAVEQKLQKIALSLEKQAAQNFFTKNFLPQNQIKSLYIHGDVGRGKSMLMKGFFNSLQKTAKIYFHFNGFMRLIHESLRDIRKEKFTYKDELIEAVKRVVKKNQLICFDEFQVLDIADAMLLSRIFSYLFSNKVTVIFTSNSQPSQLYKNGLQRELFLEFINKVLLVNCDIAYLDAEIDYRSQYRKNLTKRYFISNSENNQEVQAIIKNITAAKAAKPSIIKVWGRQVEIKQTFDKIAIINFDELCKNNFSASDYQAICKRFDLIFFLNIPLLMREDVNEARRLTLFIDEIYENKVALIILSEVESDKIYQEGVGSQAFKRTISRLNEIKSDQYWQMSKVNLEGGFYE